MKKENFDALMRSAMAMAGYHRGYAQAIADVVAVLDRLGATTGSDDLSQKAGWASAYIENKFGANPPQPQERQGVVPPSNDRVSSSSAVGSPAAPSWGTCRWEKSAAGRYYPLCEEAWEIERIWDDLKQDCPDCGKPVKVVQTD